MQRRRTATLLAGASTSVSTRARRRVVVLGRARDNSVMGGPARTRCKRWDFGGIIFRRCCVGHLVCPLLAGNADSAMPVPGDALKLGKLILAGRGRKTGGTAVGDGGEGALSPPLQRDS